MRSSRIEDEVEREQVSQKYRIAIAIEDFSRDSVSDLKWRFILGVNVGSTGWTQLQIEGQVVPTSFMILSTYSNINLASQRSDLSLHLNTSTSGNRAHLLSKYGDVFL